MLNGIGVSPDPVNAAKWFEKSAEQGNVDAAMWLANMYHMANGIPRNYEKAFSWFMIGAKQGNAYGQEKVAIMLRNGDGVPANAKLAHMWFVLAADAGQKNSDKLKRRLERSMSKDEIVQSEAKARRCRDSDFKDC